MFAPEGCAVRVVDLPYTVGAMVAFDEDGFASVYLNARWPSEQQKKALRHELRHIQNEDIYNSKDIRIIEREADGVPASVKRDLATLRRLGIISENWRDDPLLNLPTYEEGF